MRKFEFSKSYEEIEVHGKTYKLDFSDDKRKEYIQEIQKFHKRFQKLEKVNTDEMTEEESLQHFEDIKAIVKEIVEVLLGEGSFDQLYEDSGRSIMNIFDLIIYLKSIVEEKNTRNLEKKQKQYVKKSNKK